MDTAEKTREFEQKQARLFSVQKPFSEHLLKWEDSALPDKYDHNCFEYTAQPTAAELACALDYQKSLGAAFLKMEGNQPLEDAFGFSELEEIEVKHFGPLYGEDFSRRNIRRLYGKLTFHGAYFDNRLIAACHSFSADGITGIDGLIVDQAYRRQYAASSLLGHIKAAHPADLLILHADNEDTPKEMYLKMGFQIVDRLYEYLKTDL